MPSLGSGEIFTVLLLAFLVLGPERLPVVARKLGTFVREARSMMASVERQLHQVIDVTSSTPGTGAEELDARPTTAARRPS